MIAYIASIVICATLLLLVAWAIGVIRRDTDRNSRDIATLRQQINGTSGGRHAAKGEK